MADLSPIHHERTVGGSTLSSSSTVNEESGNNDYNVNHDDNHRQEQQPHRQRQRQGADDENRLRLSASLPVATPVLVPPDPDDDDGDNNDLEGGDHEMTTMTAESVPSQSQDRVSLTQIDIARLLADEETRTRLLPDVAIAVAEEQEPSLEIPTHDGQQQVPEASNDVHENDKAMGDLRPRGKLSAGRNSCRIVLSVVLAVLLVVVVLGVVVGLLLGSGGVVPPGENNLSPTGPKSIPTTSPTAATMLVPPDDVRPPDDFIRNAVQRISSHNLFDEATTSVQKQALQWLLAEDASYRYPSPSGGASRLAGGQVLREVMIQQRFALVTLYYATGGQNWTWEANFLTPDLNTCLWFTQNVSAIANQTAKTAPQGVVAPVFPTLRDNERPEEYDGVGMTQTGCSDEPFELISHLKLGANNLAGTLPMSELMQALCPSLRSIVIAANEELTGNLLSTADVPISCPLLDLWGMPHNKFTGPLELPSSSKFSKLRILDMTDNDLTGSPSGLSQLPMLRGLRLRSNALDGSIPSGICTLLELRELSLDGNRFTGTVPAECSDLRNLTDIALRSNLLTGSVEVFCPSKRGDVADDFRFDADCATSSFDLQFESAEVDCWCCTTCCDVNDKCKPNTFL